MHLSPGVCISSYEIEFKMAAGTLFHFSAFLVLLLSLILLLESFKTHRRVTNATSLLLMTLKLDVNQLPCYLYITLS